MTGPVASQMSRASGRPAPVYLVKGDDSSLVDEAARDLIHRLVGDEDPGLVVEDRRGPDLDVGAALDACSTPPFLASRRVVVVRDIGQLRAGEADQVAAWMAHPLETTSLVLVSGAGPTPPKLTSAAKKAGQIIDATVPTARDPRSRWLAQRLRAAPIQLDARAAARLGDHLGEDLGRLAGLLEMLAAAYGEGATICPDDLEPFLGEAGSVAPWELTDAIDQGATDTALTVLHRMVEAGQRHPLVVMAVLHRHYAAMLRLDGSGASSAAEAAQTLGLKSPFVAGKALSQLRRLGSEGVAQAVRALAAADLDLRGATGWPHEMVLEVLVARLSRLGPSAHRRPRPRTGSRR